jgi:hypothetical protein
MADVRYRFQVRTLEILDSFGIGERVWKEANHMIGARTSSSRHYLW